MPRPCTTIVVYGGRWGAVAVIAMWLRARTRAVLPAGVVRPMLGALRVGRWAMVARPTTIRLRLRHSAGTQGQGSHHGDGKSEAL